MLHFNDDTAVKKGKLTGDPPQSKDGGKQEFLFCFQVPQEPACAGCLGPPFGSAAFGVFLFLILQWVHTRGDGWEQLSNGVGPWTGSCDISGYKQREYKRTWWKLQSIQPPILPSLSANALASFIFLAEFKRPFGNVIYCLSPDCYSRVNDSMTAKWNDWYIVHCAVTKPSSQPPLLSVRL